MPMFLSVCDANLAFCVREKQSCDYSKIFMSRKSTVTFQLQFIRLCCCIYLIGRDDSRRLASHFLTERELTCAGYYINCGASQEETTGGIQWIPDEGFINVGNVSKIGTPDIVPILATVRYFPDESARKYCYSIPVGRGAKYLIRSTYYYGGFDGGEKPPVFDQIIDGTKWSTVNTTENYASGLTAYYEIVVAAQGRTLSFCLARNNQTTSSPFISALELVSLEDSMYNGTDFTKYALSTVARHSFGYGGEIVRYGACSSHSIVGS